MGVPAMTAVNVGLAAMVAGAGLLFLVAVWWSWTGDGIEIPRERWPLAMRLAGAAGWGFFMAGIFLQVYGHFTQVGVARF